MAKPKPENIATSSEISDTLTATSPSEVRVLRKDHSNSGSSIEPSPTSFARRRTSSLSLPPLVINHFKDIGTDCADGTHSQHFFPDQNKVGEKFKLIQDEGIYLYHETFLKPEISLRGLQSSDSLTSLNIPIECNPKWEKTRKELRLFADEFSKSKERSKLSQKAYKYSQGSIYSYDLYCELLSELFQGGCVTRQRVVVLFFFCSDLTITALEDKDQDYFERLNRWTFRYIRNNLSQFIALNGGWDAVIETTRSYVEIGFQIAVIGCIGYFIYSRTRLR